MFLKLLMVVNTLLLSLAGIFSTPATFVSAVGNDHSESTIMLSDPVEETDPNSLEWLVIDDYAFINLNSAKSSNIGYDPFGNTTYLFNLPFELSQEYAISQIEIDYKACNRWFLGIVGGICTKTGFAKGVVLDRENDLTFFQGSWSTGLGYRLFNYEDYNLKQIGFTTELRAVSDEVGVIHTAPSYTDFLTHRADNLDNDYSYPLLDDYQYYFSLNTETNWDTVIIRVQFKEVDTGLVVDVPCGKDGLGCEVDSPDKPFMFLAFFNPFIDFFENNLILSIGILVVVLLLFKVLSILIKVPLGIFSVGKGFIIILSKGFVIFWKIKVKLIKIIIHIIKWLIIKLWISFGHILNLIGKLYSKITSYFYKRKQKKTLRNRGA